MRFHPPEVNVPEEMYEGSFLLRPLQSAHVELDYDAVMEDPAYLRTWSQSSWPANDFTLSENLKDLERHEREHREGIAFTYTVLSPGSERCLGCVYITPLDVRIAASRIPAAKRPDPETFSADVCFWVRPSEIPLDLDYRLLLSLKAWLAGEWRFDSIFIHTSAADERQSSLFKQAGLERIASFEAKKPRPGNWALYMLH